MQKDLALRIAAHPSYQALVKKRSRFGWSLTFVMLFLYYGYIYLVAFNKEFLSRTLGDSVTTYSIPIGIGVILLTVLLTGIYVRRANAEFDNLTNEIKKDFQ